MLKIDLKRGKKTVSQEPFALSLMGFFGHEISCMLFNV